MNTQEEIDAFIEGMFADRKKELDELGRMIANEAWLRAELKKEKEGKI